MITICDNCGLETCRCEQIEKELIKDRMWRDSIRNTMGLCVICSRCGGGSVSTCKCSKELFKSTITDKQIDEYRINNLCDKLQEL